MKSIEEKKSEALLLFKKETRILENARNVLGDDDVPLSVLAGHFETLCSEYENLLKVASRITRISDNYQKNLIEANEKIESQKVQLEKLNAAKDKLFSIVAHDLKGAFGSFKTGFDLLSVHADELDREDVKNVAMHLKQSGTAFFDLLENLLHWSRLQMGGIAHRPKAVDLAQAVADVFEILEETARKKNIRLENEVSFETSVFADENMLFSVLQNLASNAVKFSESGASVVASCENLGDEIEISVRDSGLGMEEDRIENLLRIDKQTTTPGTAGEKGTGLGLVLCKEFVEKNGGRIRLKSRPGKGTTATFTLPRAFRGL